MLTAPRVIYIGGVFNEYKICKCLIKSSRTPATWMCLDCENFLDHLSHQGVLNISYLNLNPRCFVIFCCIAVSVCEKFVQTSQSNNKFISQLFNPATQLHLVKIHIILTRQILLICDFNLDLNQRDIDYIPVFPPRFCGD